MTPLNATRLTTLLVLLLGSAPAAGQARQARPNRGAVAADHAAASLAGAQVLRAGGNAIDAAVASALALGVVNPTSSGLGGGGFAIVYLARQNTLIALDFREVAPAALTPASFVVDGKVRAELATLGGLAVGVPGELAGLHKLSREYGRLPWPSVVSPARNLARGGFSVSWFLAKAAREFLMGPNRDKPEVTALRHQLAQLGVAGSDWSRRDLAATLADIAKNPRALYQGRLAKSLVKTVADHGGVLTTKDLEAYSVVIRTPLVGTWNGYRIATMPLPSSGGVALLESLALLDNYRATAAWPSERGMQLHWIAEALKHAFADRAAHLGDVDGGSAVAARLLDPTRLKALAKKTDLSRTGPPERYGLPVEADLDDGGTSHVCAIDSEGNAVALTTTVNGYFGSKLITPDGIVLNNQMDDFALRAGAVNQFGLVQSKANLVTPGKRPLSSMTPTLVLDDSGVRGCVGGSGGPYIISATLQVLVSAFGDKLAATDAVSRPRIHHQWKPNELVVLPAMPEHERRVLRAAGHKVVQKDREAVVQLIKRDGSTFDPASDPRKGGRPAITN